MLSSYLNRLIGVEAARCQMLHATLDLPRFCLRRRFSLECSVSGDRLLGSQKSVCFEHALSRTRGTNGTAGSSPDQFHSAFVSKNDPKLKHVDAFRDILAEVKEYFPQYAAVPLYPIFASLYVPDHVAKYCTRHGIYALGMGPETMQILNLSALPTAPNASAGA